MISSLKEFRKNKIEEKFVNLITEYDFDLLDPDQAYLNYLCYDKIYMLSNGWNKEPMPTPCKGNMNIVHYALYKKPWQYDDVMYGEYFWHYAKRSPFYEKILLARQSFGEAEKAKKKKEIETQREEASKGKTKKTIPAVYNKYTSAGSCQKAEIFGKPDNEHRPEAV